MSPYFLGIVAASSAFDLALVLAVLLLRSPWRWFVAAGGIAFALFKASVLTAAGRSLFFLIQLAYVDVVIVLPLAAAFTLVAGRRRTLPGALRASAWTALVALPAVGVYATCVEPFRLVEERVSIRVDPRRAPPEPMRIAVLADLQSSEVLDHHRDAVQRAMAFEPHLVLLPGDLIQLDAGDSDYDAKVPEFRELLSALDAPLGVYFVLGNTDWRQGVGRVFEGTRVRLLIDETAELDFHGRKVLVGGADFGRRANEFVRRFDEREGDELRILVSHYPDAILGLDDSPGLDLAIAGHTHGGQVRLPWFGPPITLSRVPRSVAAGGLHAIDGRAIYVSRGIGWEGGSAPRIRFLCPPEVSLLTIEPAR